MKTQQEKGRVTRPVFPDYTLPKNLLRTAAKITYKRFFDHRRKFAQYPKPNFTNSWRSIEGIRKQTHFQKMKVRLLPSLYLFLQVQLAFGPFLYRIHLRLGVISGAPADGLYPQEISAKLIFSRLN